MEGRGGEGRGSAHVDRDDHSQSEWSSTFRWINDELAVCTFSAIGLQLTTRIAASREVLQQAFRAIDMAVDRSTQVSTRQKGMREERNAGRLTRKQ